MDVAIWIVAWFLAAIFAGTGITKLTKSPDELVESGMGYAEHLSPRLLRVIGLLELLAAVGLVVPPLVGVATGLSPAAAIGLVLLMAGAIVVHVRRRELQEVLVATALLAMAGFVAWGRLAA